MTKLKVGAELERIVLNYYLLNMIDSVETSRILHALNNVLGCQAPDAGECRIIPFPAPVPQADRKPEHSYWPTAEARHQEQEARERRETRLKLEAQGLKTKWNVYERLHNLGVDSIEKMNGVSEEDLLSCRNVGTKTVNDIKAFLQSKGIYLKD
jgi:hypothetical protein